MVLGMVAKRTFMPLLLTDVYAIHRDFGTASAEPIPKLTVAEVGGICGKFEDFLAILNGRSGTRVVSGDGKRARYELIKVSNQATK